MRSKLASKASNSGGPSKAQWRVASGPGLGQGLEGVGPRAEVPARELAPFDTDLDQIRQQVAHAPLAVQNLLELGLRK